MTCSKCGLPLESGAAYCGNCGQTTGPAAASEPPTTSGNDAPAGSAVPVGVTVKPSTPTPPPEFSPAPAPSPGETLPTPTPEAASDLPVTVKPTVEPTPVSVPISAPAAVSMPTPTAPPVAAPTPIAVPVTPAPVPAPLPTPAVAQPAVTPAPIAGLDPAPAAGGKGLGVAAVVVGIISILASIFNIIDIPVAVTGIVLGIFGRKGAGRKLATIGIVLSVIGLALASAVLAFGLSAAKKTAKTTPATTTSAKTFTSPCYSVVVPEGFGLDDKDAATCSMQLADATSGDLYLAKPVDSSGVTAANLPALAKSDLENGAKTQKGVTIDTQGASTFVGSSAYRGVLKNSTTKQLTEIVYVYHQAGYQINGKTINVFAIIYSSTGANANGSDTLAKGWTWK